MDSWKDSARKRKDYRRGGTEPVPEVPRKHRGRVEKIYRLEVFRGSNRFSHPEENPTWRKDRDYEKFEGAVDALNAIGRKRIAMGWCTLYCHPYRIVNTQTGEVLIERDYTEPKEEV